MKKGRGINVYVIVPAALCFLLVLVVKYAQLGNVDMRWLRAFLFASAVTVAALVFSGTLYVFITRTIPRFVAWMHSEREVASASEIGKGRVLYNTLLYSFASMLLISEVLIIIDGFSYLEAGIRLVAYGLFLFAFYLIRKGTIDLRYVLAVAMIGSSFMVFLRSHDLLPAAVYWMRLLTAVVGLGFGSALIASKAINGYLIDLKAQRNRRKERKNHYYI